MNCKICGHFDLKNIGSTKCNIIFQIKDINDNRTIYKCRKCGSISISPMPSSFELLKYYNEYSKDDNCYIDRNVWFKRESFKWIKKICTEIKSGNILDIGCANGELLSLLPSSFNKFGIDISERSCKIAKNKGITTYCAEFDSIKLKTKFDIIIALDFLEHIQNPIQSINEIINLLSPGGYIIFETGDASSFSARFLKSDWYYTSTYGHLNILTLNILSKILKNVSIDQILLKRIWHKFPNIFIVIYRNFLAFGFHFFRIFYRLVKRLSEKSMYMKKLYLKAPPGAYQKDHIIYIGKKI